jgi:hypothetical protein
MPIQRAVNLEARIHQPPLPLEQPVVIGNLQRKMVRPADTGMAFRRVGPLEERHRRTGLRRFVAEIQVIGAGIIEVDRFLDQPQPQHLRIKINRPLGVGANQRNVVYPLNSQGKILRHRR